MKLGPNKAFSREEKNATTFCVNQPFRLQPNLGYIFDTKSSVRTKKLKTFFEKPFEERW